MSSPRCTTSSRSRPLSRRRARRVVREHNPRTATRSRSACGPSAGAPSTSPSCSERSTAERRRVVGVRDATADTWLNARRAHPLSPLGDPSPWQSSSLRVRVQRRRERRRRQPDQSEQPADALPGAVNGVVPSSRLVNVAPNCIAAREAGPSLARIFAMAREINDRARRRAVLPAALRRGEVREPGEPTRQQSRVRRDRRHVAERHAGRSLVPRLGQGG